MITLTLTIRLTAAEAARDDGAGAATVLAIAREQAHAVTDAVNGIAYVEAEAIATPAEHPEP